MTTPRRAGGRRLGSARSTRARLDTLDQQLQMAYDRQRDDDRLIQVALAGGASVKEWASVLGDEPEQLLLEALPSLLLRRARRLAGLPQLELRGIDPHLDLALEVLAHHPDEDITDAMMNKMKTMAEAPRGITVSPGDRWLTARALAVAGPDGGGARRWQLWESGLVADRGRENCDPHQWSNLSLLDWAHLDALFEADLDADQRAEVERGATVQFSYLDLTRMIHNGLLNSPEAANRGQVRPDEVA